MLEELFSRMPDAQSRWASFENPAGAKGQAGRENGRAKGHAFHCVEAGETKTLLNVDGSGVINRIWLTLSDRSAAMLRSLRLQMFWNHAEKPAVSVPLGDFFCAAMGKMTAFESCLFSNPEGRSFNCFIQMPFLTGAKITLTNESDVKLIHLFYDVDYTLKPMDAGRMLYFHSHWNRENPTALCRDYEILPRLDGEGRFLGVNMGVNANKIYGGSWFGEGEFKVWLDGDGECPTLCGTGTEDFIGTAWGQGVYSHMTQGCLVSDAENQAYVFYRFHIHDPIYFHESIRVAMQDIGGANKDHLLGVIGQGAPCKIVSRDGGDAGFEGLYEKAFAFTSDSPDGWYNYYRQDDFSSTAYFYYDRPVSELSALADVSGRVEGII